MGLHRLMKGLNGFFFRVMTLSVAKPRFLMIIIVCVFASLLLISSEILPLQRKKFLLMHHLFSYQVPEVLFEEENASRKFPDDSKPDWNTNKKLNVLFIMADDLRPQIGAYEGKDYAAPYDKRKIYTPNMDRLASKSLVLKRAYAQYSLCGPSRASMLTSRRPDTTKVYQNVVSWRNSGGNLTSLPEHFKNNGYEVSGVGKIVHVDNYDDKDDEVSWTSPYFHANNVRHVTTANVNWLAVPETERAKEPLEDEQIVQRAIQNLQEFAPKARTGERPFFQAVGFYRPHVPHICPEEFYDLYPLEKGNFMSNVTWQTPSLGPYCTMAELQKGTNNSELTRIPLDAMKKLRRAYFACVSYVDHLIGMLLDSLDELGLADSTIVSLVADHGYHLGENDWYSKYTTHEISLHVPLMIHIPGHTDQGVHSRSLVELLDVFPTITEAAGLGTLKKCPQRSNDMQLCTDGTSLLHLIKHPGLHKKSAVYSQIARGKGMMEYTIKTDKYRLVDLASIKRRYPSRNVSDHDIYWDQDFKWSVFERRLYNHDIDPEETNNLFTDPAYQKQVDKLQERLHNRFSTIPDFTKDAYEAYGS